MPVSEIDKVSLVAKDDSLPVEQRITAVREWLRLTNYSARSCIIARRIAKKLLRDDATVLEMRQKAQRLLNFVEKGVQAKSRPAQEPTASAAPSTQVTAATPQGDTLIYDYKRIFWVTVGCEGVTEEETLKIRDEVYQTYGAGRPLWTHENGKFERTKFGDEVYAQFMAAIAAAVAKKKAEAPSIPATQEHYRWE